MISIIYLFFLSLGVYFSSRTKLAGRNWKCRKKALNDKFLTLKQS